MVTVGSWTNKNSSFRSGLRFIRPLKNGANRREKQKKIEAIKCGRTNVSRLLDSWVIAVTAKRRKKRYCRGPKFRSIGPNHETDSYVERRPVSGLQRDSAIDTSLLCLWQRIFLTTFFTSILLYNVSEK